MKIFDTFKKNPLVLLAAIVQAAAFALAGSVYFGPFGWLLGGGAGVVVNLSMALASSRISEIAKARRPLAWAAFLLLFALSPFAVAPAEYLLLSSRAALLPQLAILVAIVWSLLPDAAIIAAGGVAGRALVTVDQATPAAVSGAPSGGQRRSAKKPTKLFRCECGSTFANPAQYSGHCRSCSAHIEAKTKVIPVDLHISQEQHR